MSCVTNKLTADILSDCSTKRTGGLEVKGWLINRREIEASTIGASPNIITAINLAQGKKAFTFTGVKKVLNSGFDRTVAMDRPDMFTHFLAFQAFEFSAAAKLNIDEMGNLVAIVENKDKSSGNGTFQIFGWGTGLYVSSDTQRANDNDGVRYLELTSQEGELEKYSSYHFFNTDYATTLAALVALETPAT